MKWSYLYNELKNVFSLDWFFFSSFMHIFNLFANYAGILMKQKSLNFLFFSTSQQMGHSNSDAVKVPFTLPAGTQNEGQFAFGVEEITAPQKLRGTLTYILKSADGSSHEKVDFKINLPCSSYLLTLPCKRWEMKCVQGSGQSLSICHLVVFVLQQSCMQKWVITWCTEAAKVGSKYYVSVSAIDNCWLWNVSVEVNFCAKKLKKSTVCRCEVFF